jgi:hypothetical protein
MTDPHQNFPDPLDTRLYGYRGQEAVEKLTHYFRYCNPKHPIITVPCGSLTDGASIPKCFHNIMGPRGPWYRAAVIHDYLYSLQSSKYYPGIKRKMADQIFLDAMVDCGVGFVTRQTIYRAVRAFGWFCYKKPEKPVKKV